MSTALIARSSDLKRLRDEGYDIAIHMGRHLIVRQVPHVAPDKTVRRGSLVMPLDIEVDHTIAPSNHQAWWAGEHPSDLNGEKLQQLVHSTADQSLAEGLVVNHAFSSKPKSGAYSDFYKKVVNYVTIISSPATQLEPGVTAKVFPIIRDDDGPESPHVYMDTASTRAGIGAISDKLRRQRVGIVGCGGTGSYVLDFLVKTLVAEIHLYDGDVFEQHTAFRSPGAATEGEIGERALKTKILGTRYAAMHRGIVTHGYLSHENVEELTKLDFVFIAIDSPEPKALIIDRLEAADVPFVDVGMGLHIVNDSLRGQLRTTISTPAKRDHVRGNFRIPLDAVDGPNDYSTNIQIVELNALNAAIAVIKWKKYLSFYLDEEREHFSVYQLGGNTIINEDCA